MMVTVGAEVQSNPVELIPVSVSGHRSAGGVGAERLIDVLAKVEAIVALDRVEATEKVSVTSQFPDPKLVAVADRELQVEDNNSDSATPTSPSSASMSGA